MLTCKCYPFKMLNDPETCTFNPFTSLKNRYAIEAPHACMEVMSMVGMHIYY